MCIGIRTKQTRQLQTVVIYYNFIANFLHSRGIPKPPSDCPVSHRRQSNYYRITAGGPELIYM